MGCQHHWVLCTAGSLLLLCCGFVCAQPAPSAPPQTFHDRIDEADAFATLRLLRIGSDFSQRVLAESAKNWFLNARRDQDTGEQPIYYGEHSMSQQRAYEVVCLMVGSDPSKFKSLADEAQMPPERQES